MANEAPAAPTATVRSNILHGYANYTYGLQMWAISVKPGQGFNLIGGSAITPGKEPTLLNAGELLISNGGQGPDSMRSPSFPTDFVIDNLEIESLVGNKGGDARGTDALTIKFDIIEPYTVTLLNRLRDVAIRNGFNADYKSIIYCMKISFYGYDDKGTPQLIDSTKYIPFTLLNIKFNITNKGALYSCQGIPAQNMILTMLDNQVPFHVEMQGQTIQDLFNATVIEKSTKSAGTAARTDTAPKAPNSGNTTVTKGIKTALDDNEKFYKSNKAQEEANEYCFEFAPELAAATVITSNKISDEARKYSNVKGAAGADEIAKGKVGQLTLDSTTGTFRSQAGTKITDLIKSVLTVSDFMRKQYSETPNKNMPVRGWKIIPKLEIKGYDKITHYFTRKVTYVVKLFDYYGEAHPNMGQKAVPPSSVVKKYEYLFTGNNRDVMKVDLNFQMAFFEVRNGVKSNYVDDSNSGSGEIDGSSRSDTPTNVGQDLRLFTPIVKPVTGIASEQLQAATTNDKEAITVGEMMTKLLDNGVDVMSLDIEIVGDPDWVQQDNVLYGDTTDTTAKTLPNGTINFQDSITCFDFTFKSPSKDYDDTTGLFDLSNSDTAVFSGTYQVIKVSNNFRKGRFTQKLTNVRVPIQKDTDVKPKANAAGAAPVDKQPVVTPAPTPTPSLPAIGQNELNADGLFNGITGATQTPTFMTGA